MKNFQLAPLRHYYRPREWQKWLERHWLRIIMVALAVHLLFSKDISFQVSMGNPSSTIAQNDTPPSGNIAQATALKSEEKGKKKKWKDRKANTFSNLTFVLSPDYGERHNVDPAIVRQKIQNCKDYVAKYKEVAIAEREKYGIPVAITLAQGLLESNAGDSRLSVESNNHFGIKCRTKCRGCTCRNYVDDDVYDMFRVFDSVWGSYREHSKLLQNKRYRWLKKYPVTDYESWAHGLKKSGYATDKRYAPKLIKIIEELKLDRLDK
ncbi:MAG: glycoside hydrolase family 73 protein [Saprospiraceae bacterium]